MPQVRVAAIQNHPQLGCLSQNRTALLKLVGDLKADVVVLPELCTSGYCFQDLEQARSLAEPVPGGPTTDMLVAIASSTGATAVGGVAELGADGQLYNTAAVVYPNGYLTKYRKLHLFGDEPRWFAPGDELPPVIFTPCGLQVGVMICFDWRFPEVARYLATQGAQLIAHPSNLVLPRGGLVGMPVRCKENEVFAVVANRVGEQVGWDGKVVRFIGQSQILDAGGEVLAVSSALRPQVLVAEIDTAHRRGALSRLTQLRSDRFHLQATFGPEQAGPRRVAFVEHTTAATEQHVDFLLEDHGLARAWRFPSMPNATICGERTFDHRADYFNYEGAVTGGRGTVRIIKKGTAHVHSSTVDSFVFDLDLGEQTTRVELRQVGERRWAWIELEVVKAVDG